MTKIHEYEMRFPIGLPQDHEEDYVSAEKAVEILRKYPNCRVALATPQKMSAWNALCPSERDRLSVEGWHELDYYVALYPSLDEYILRGYKEWRGGNGLELVVPCPIPELPFRIAVGGDSGRDTNGDYTKMDVLDAKTGERTEYYWHSMYLGVSGYISHPRLPIVADRRRA